MSGVVHEPGPAPLWSESWYVDFADDRGRGGYLRLITWPHHSRAWLWAAWVDGERLVLVRDHDVPLPRGRGLEIRGTGLWADLICETPAAHWTFGLEAFGVALDEPADAYGDERGIRTPLGFDLEWEALIPAFAHPGAATRPDSGHEQHAGRVHGEVLVGDERLVFDGAGERDHSWGARDWWDVGWHWAAFRLGDGVAASVARPDRPGSEHATGYLAREGGDPHPLVRAEVRTEWAGEGLPRRVSYVLEDDLEIDAEVAGLAPLLVPAHDGALVSRLARALCRFHSTEGEGAGWAEWLLTP